MPSDYRSFSLGSFQGISLVVSPSLTTEKFNPHRYGIKKQPTGSPKRNPQAVPVPKNLLLSTVGTRGTRKNYYILNFMNENRIIKNVYYIQRDRNLLFLCVLMFRPYSGDIQVIVPSSPNIAIPFSMDTMPDVFE